MSALKYFAVPFFLICLAIFLYAKTDDILPVLDFEYQKKTEALIQAIESGTVHVSEKQFVEFLQRSIRTNNAVEAHFLSLRNVFKNLSTLLFSLALLQCGIIAYTIRTKR